jgi:hypothetical protein
MTLSTLPKTAFLPGHPLNENDRRALMERRDKLFLLCTPAEQQCLIELARWYESHRLEISGEPNIVKQSFLAVFYHRHLPWANQKPGLIVRLLAKLSGAVYKLERWNNQRFQSDFITRMGSLVHEVDEDVLLGAINFFRILPLDAGFDGQRTLMNKLDAMASRCVANPHVSASRRFAALQRSVQSTYGPTGLQRGLDEPNLRKQAWPLLLEIAHENMATAVRLIDEHWDQTPARPPQILMSLHLHESPELAYQLAVTLKPHRPGFAVDMLREFILYSSFQLKRLDQPAAIALEKVMDASCQLLADWTFDTSLADTKSPLRAMDSLFRHGNPEEGYWQKIPRECLAVIKSLEPAAQDRQLSLLAQAVFYGDSFSQLAAEAHELFKACVVRRLGEPWARDREGDLERAIRDACESLSILEEKVMSFRNRRIAASPDHPLLHTVHAQLQGFLERLLANEPSAALSRIVSLTLALSNQMLIRKYHRILRDEFEARAGDFPADAGLALKQLIQYCGYSQADDEMYRKDLCRESFNALLPVLEGISPTDAAVARTGIGWNPRGDI